MGLYTEYHKPMISYFLHGIVDGQYVVESHSIKDSRFSVFYEHGLRDTTYWSFDFVVSSTQGTRIYQGIRMTFRGPRDIGIM